MKLLLKDESAFVLLETMNLPILCLEFDSIYQLLLLKKQYLVEMKQTIARVQYNAISLVVDLYYCGQMFPTKLHTAVCKEIRSLGTVLG